MEIAILVFFVAIFGGAAFLAFLVWVIFRRRPGGVRRVSDGALYGESAGTDEEEDDHEGDADDQYLVGNPASPRDEGANDAASAGASALAEPASSSAGPAEPDPSPFPESGVAAVEAASASDSGSASGSASDYDSGSNYDSGPTSDSGSGSDSSYSSSD